MIALGVQRVGGHDNAVQIQWLQQRLERRQLVGLAVDFDLRHDRAVPAGAGGQQVAGPARGGVMAGAA
jgi:hypothetical protein